MATIFKNKVIKDVGTNPIEIIETNSATRVTVIGLSLTNLTDSFVYVSVLIKDDTSVTGYYIKDSLLPANTSLRVVATGEKLIVAPDNCVQVVASVDDAVDAVASFVEEVTQQTYKTDLSKDIFMVYVEMMMVNCFWLELIS